MGCTLAIVFQVRSLYVPTKARAQRRGYLLGVCFQESLVFRLHSEIDQIHLSIEAQCGTPVYLWVTATWGMINFFTSSINSKFDHTLSLKRNAP